MYGLGHSERLLGGLLAQVDRERVVVSSKVGYFAGTAAHPYQRRQILRQLETTLDNLNIGYLDLYCLHSIDFGPADRHRDDAIETMQDLRGDGLIRAVGMRAPHEFAQEWAADLHHPRAAETARFLHLFDRVQPDVITARHNLLSRPYAATETDIFAFARHHNVGVLMKQVLGQGILLNTHDPANPPAFPPDDHRHADHRFTAPTLHAIRNGLERIRERLDMNSADPAHLALRYALDTSHDAVALIGFRNAHQITGTLVGLGPPLASGDIDEIRRVMAPARAMLDGLAHTEDP